MTIFIFQLRVWFDIIICRFYGLVIIKNVMYKSFKGSFLSCYFPLKHACWGFIESNNSWIPVCMTFLSVFTPWSFKRHFMFLCLMPQTIASHIYSSCSSSFCKSHVRWFSPIYLIYFVIFICSLAAQGPAGFILIYYSIKSLLLHLPRLVVFYT